MLPRRREFSAARIVARAAPAGSGVAGDGVTVGRGRGATAGTGARGATRGATRGAGGAGGARRGPGPTRANPAAAPAATTHRPATSGSASCAGVAIPTLPKSVACCTPSEVTRCSRPLSGSVAALPRPGRGSGLADFGGGSAAPSTWVGAPGGAARGGRHRWRRLRGGGSGGSGGGGGLEDAGQAPATEAGEGPGRLQEVPPEGDLLQGASPRAEGQQGGEVGPVQVQRLGVRVVPEADGAGARGAGEGAQRAARAGPPPPGGGDVLYPGQEGLWREVEGEDEAPRRRERGLLEGESGSSLQGGGPGRGSRAR